MAETIDLRKVKWELRKRKAIDKAKELCKTTKTFVAENQKAVVAGAALAGAAIQKGYRAYVKSRESFDKDTRFYDHSLGCYYRTRRRLSADELRSITRRKKNGESYGDILASMKLLK